MRKRSFQRNSKRTYDKFDEGKIGNPGRPPLSDGKDKPDITISTKSLKGLPKTPVSLQADPYTNALPGTMPYPLLNVYNKNVGGSYAGYRNLDGGTTIQYSNSATSGFLHCFDSALIGIGLNYRYLPILASDTQRGRALVDEMRKAISEATSTLSATTFTAQNIYYYAIETDMPMGSATTTPIDPIEGSKKINAYTNIEDVIYAFSIFYQIILQSAALSFNNFNVGRALQDTMINMSWNREVPYLNSYFGLLNKKSFLAVWDSIAYALEGEYFDSDFMVQTNLLSLIPSRRSNSMTDPLQEVLTTFNLPTTFRVYLCSSTAKTAAAVKILDLADLQYTPAGGAAITYQEACYDLNIKMKANDTLLWARRFANQVATETATQRFNLLVDDIACINYCLTVLKTAVNDLRTVFDIMHRSGVNRWQKGHKLKIAPITKMDVNNNITVNNIYSMIGSGSPSMTFDDTTKRWSSFSLWNLYYGIPEHDAYAGGSFFSFSTKNLNIAGASDTNIAYLPVAFEVLSSEDFGKNSFCRVLNRLGTSTWFAISEVTIADSAVHARLAPLQAQDSYNIRVANVDATLLNSFDQSWLYRLGQQLFGLASIKLTSTLTDYSLDPDILVVYDYQIEDFTNEVITYARSNAPFIANADDTSFLGFYGMSKKG